MAYIRVEDTLVVGVSVAPADGLIEIPLPVEDIEALLIDNSKVLKYVNGDLTVANNPRYWQAKFDGAVQSLTRPEQLTVNYGDNITLPVSDIPIIVAHAGTETQRTRVYCDTNGALHVLTTYEWKHVLEIISDTLSQLSQIRATVTVVPVDTEDRYESMIEKLKLKVDAAYGRP